MSFDRDIMREAEQAIAEALARGAPLEDVYVRAGDARLYVSRDPAAIVGESVEVQGEMFYVGFRAVDVQAK